MHEIQYKIQYQALPSISWIQDTYAGCARIPAERSVVRYLGCQDTDLQKGDNIDIVDKVDILAPVKNNRVSVVINKQ